LIDRNARGAESLSQTPITVAEKRGGNKGREREEREKGGEEVY